MTIKKKILFLSPLPPPHYGSAISSLMCLDILNRSDKFDVHNIKLNFSKDMKNIGKINFRKIKGVLRIRKEIKEYFKNNQPDIVYIVPGTTSVGLIRDSYLTKLIFRIFDGPIILHIRSRILKKDWRGYFSGKMLRDMLRSKRVIVLGEELVSDLHEIVPKKDIFILPNAIKNDVSDEEVGIIIKKRGGNKKLELLFLSNMERSKGWLKVLESCVLLKKRNMDFHCSFVGEWKEKGDEVVFDNFIKVHNLERNVEYLGAKFGKDKGKILEKSDILLFPTEYPLETFGRVIIEGMMYGLPVIANGIATIPDIIKNGESGFVLQDNTPEEIAENVLKLRDRELRGKMGKIGRSRFLDKYEAGDYAKKFVGIFENNSLYDH